MATTDKTRQRLVETMRKTKAASPAALAVKKKRVSRKPARAAARPGTGSTERMHVRERHERRIAAADAYQAGVRVWPD